MELKNQCTLSILIGGKVWKKDGKQTKELQITSAGWPKDRERKSSGDLLRLTGKTMPAKRGERLIREHTGQGSWCNADSITMETNGGKAQTRRRGLKRKEESAASNHGGWLWGCFDERGGDSWQMSNKCCSEVKWKANWWFRDVIGVKMSHLCQDTYIFTDTFRSKSSRFMVNSHK